MLELTLTLAPAEGALLRLLGLVERRGFPLGAIQTRPSPAGLDVRLTLPVDGRPGDVLLRQVQRLHDVREARIDFIQPRPAATTWRAGAPAFPRVEPAAARDIHSYPAGGLPA